MDYELIQRIIRDLNALGHNIDPLFADVEENSAEAEDLATVQDHIFDAASLLGQIF